MPVNTQNKKTLTIAIPSFNSQETLEACLSSFIAYVEDSRLQVIVVDDGSSDATADIARIYCDKYPEIFCLVQKSNGGHGSAINVALSLATGKYFKVVDSDDAVDSKNLITLLDFLEHSDIDAVINSFLTIDCKTQKRTFFCVNCKLCNKNITLNELLSVYDQIGACCAIHGLTYKTTLLLDINLKLTEGVFYEDNEFVILPFLQVKTIMLLPFVIYHYTVGQTGQSIAVHNQVERIHHKEKVIYRLFNEIRISPNINFAQREYIRRRMLALLAGYLVTAFLMDKNKSKGTQDASRLKGYLIEYEPDIWKALSKKFYLLRLLGAIYFPVWLYQLMVNQLFLRKLFRKFLK